MPLTFATSVPASSSTLASLTSVILLGRLGRDGNRHGRVHARRESAAVQDLPIVQQLVATELPPWLGIPYTPAGALASALRSRAALCSGRTHQGG